MRPPPLALGEIGTGARQDVVEDHDRVGGGELGSPEPSAGGFGNPPGVPEVDAGAGRGAIRRSVSRTASPPPPVSTCARGLGGGAQIGRRAGHVERGARGHQRRVDGRLRAAAAQDLQRDARVVGRLAAAQANRIALVEAEVGRAQVVGADVAVRQLGDEGAPGRRELVEAAGAVDDHGALRPEGAVRLGQDLAPLAAEDPVDVKLRAARIGERAEQIEDRPDADLLARRVPRAGSPRGARGRRERPASPRAGSAPPSRGWGPGRAPATR